MKIIYRINLKLDKSEIISALLISKRGKEYVKKKSLDFLSSFCVLNKN